MPTYVALLRASNLGARRKFPKADLQRVVEATGATDAAEEAREAPFEVGAQYVSFLVAERDSYHTAKLPARLERRLGVSTNRNVTVVSELARRWGA